MSLQDKIRDQLYGSVQDEEKSEQSAAGLGDFLESQDRPYAAPKTLLVCLLVEAAVLGAIYFKARSVWNIVSTGQGLYIGLGVPFFLVFMIAFAAYKILKWKFSPPSPPPEGVMS